MTGVQFHRRGGRADPTAPEDLPLGAKLIAHDRDGFWRQVRVSTARVVALTTVLGLLYSFAPLGRAVDMRVGLELVGAVVLLLVVTALEIRSVARSAWPEIRALEAVAITLPLVLLPFASAYYVTSHETVTSFSEPLSRLDALYFTVVTFATVGFGDISATSEAARLMVTIQISVDLILIGVIAKVVLGTARRRREDMREDAAAADTEDSGQELGS